MNHRAVALFLLTLTTAGALCAQPQPLPLTPPRAPADTVFLREGAIEKLVLTPRVALPAVKLPAPLAAEHSISFWFRVEDSPALWTTGYGDEHPVTILDVNATERDSQRLVFRIMEGRFELTAYGDGKWKALRGLATKVKPGQWYFAVYTRSAQGGILYVNGDIALRSPAAAPAHDRLQVVAFGNFDRRRRMNGTLLEPRLYGLALTKEQVRDLFQFRPQAAR